MFPWVDLTIQNFSYFKLDSVFLRLLSSPPKLSLWAHNKQVTFPVQHFDVWSPALFPGFSLWRISSPEGVTICPGSCTLSVFSSLTLFHLFDMPLKGEALELNILLLMIKIHLLSKCISINVMLIKSPLELIDYHETEVCQEQAYYKN